MAPTLTLTDYQVDAAAKLSTAVCTMLENFTHAQGMPVVFKAPTGAGKTVTMGEVIRLISEAPQSKPTVILWCSINDLHEQSKAKLQGYLADSSVQLMSLGEISDDNLADGTVLFANWHSLTKLKDGQAANSAVKNKEDGLGLMQVLSKVRETANIVLVVDESQVHYLSTQTQAFIQEVVQPRVIVEVSATPKITIDRDDESAGKAFYHSIPHSAVITAGMIKNSIIINEDYDDEDTSTFTPRQAALIHSLAKRVLLAAKYRKEDINVNPLIIIQLPSDNKKVSELDKSVREEVEEYLATQGIDYENGRLAVWLTDDGKNNSKVNLEGIEDNQSRVEVLIFKTAIATGWDCPRAQILTALRDVQSETFREQVVGRILRMPEARYYTDQALNSSYIYTDVNSFNVDNTGLAPNTIKDRGTGKTLIVEGPGLTSCFVHRQGFGDLTSRFKPHLKFAFANRFGITDEDTSDTAYKKVSSVLKLEATSMGQSVIAPHSIENIASLDSIVGGLEHLNLSVDDSSASRVMDHLCNAWSLPFPPARSSSKIKRGLSDILKDFNRTELDNAVFAARIIACSEDNQNVLRRIVDAAKEAFKTASDTFATYALKQFTFNLPASLFYASDQYSEITYNRYAYTDAFFHKNQPQTEVAFQKQLDRNKSVLWWYKNGESNKTDFAISYHDETRTRLFFPDYIVRFGDGTTGIYDTKSGTTASVSEAGAKSDALQAFITQHNENEGQPKLKGGIVYVERKDFYLYSSPCYEQYTKANSSWRRILESVESF